MADPISILADSLRRKNPKRRTIPAMEGLEARLVLYSTFGSWAYDSRITYSFMPDGTNVGGTPSNLFSTLNAKFATTTWQQQIQIAATLWENVTGANLALVPDGGQNFGTQGNQQDDPRFGDIRIGAVPLSSGLLAETFVPPPGNGGTAAGDILLNSNVNWQIGSSYDLLTVVAHEFGHTMGLGESTVTSAVMYGTYNGTKTSLTTDDIQGVDSLYATRTPDQFNANGQTDSTYTHAANITSYLNASNQISLPGLQNTTSAGAEWYYVSAPASTASTMRVTVQSSALSSFAPQVQIYTTSMSLVSHASAADVFGATVATSATNVTPGSGYYIRVFAAGGPSAIGSYGLQVNFGGNTQAAIAPPNTAVAEQSDSVGATSNDNAPTGGLLGSVLLQVGSITGLGFTYGITSSLTNSIVAIATATSTPVDGTVSTLIGVLPPTTSSSSNSSTSSVTSVSAATSTATTSPTLIAQSIDDAILNLYE